VTTSTPLYKSALLCLAEAWPGALPFSQLAALAHARLGLAASGNPADAGGTTHALASSILQGFAHGLVRLHTHLPAFVLEAGTHPAASPLAREQAVAGTSATNLCHEEVPLSDVERLVLRNLNGSRDRTALLEILVELQTKGPLQVEQKGQAVTDPRVARQILGEMLAQSLARLARCAFLVG
jgi:methyltransferase-like protein